MCIRDRCDAVTERIAAGQDISELETDAQALLDHYGMDNYGTLAITVLSAYIDDYERMAMAVSYTHLDVYKRQGSDAVAAADAAESAGLSDSVVVLVSVGARDKVGRVSRDHADQTLHAGVFAGAGPAAVALGGVDDHIAVGHLHGVELTDTDAVAAADASVLTFSSRETGFCRLTAGSAREPDVYKRQLFRWYGRRPDS